MSYAPTHEKRIVGGIEWQIELPAAIAAAIELLKRKAIMCFAIGLARLRGVTAEPKVFSRGIADGPFAGFLGQFHKC